MVMENSEEVKKAVICAYRKRIRSADSFLNIFYFLLTGLGKHCSLVELFRIYLMNH